MSYTKLSLRLAIVATLVIVAAFALTHSATLRANSDTGNSSAAVLNAVSKVEQGERIFRFDTFGDQAFWGDTLKLHQAIEGAKLGGVGPGVSPKTALAVGLKVDLDALPSSLLEQIGKGKVNLDDPAVTLALLKLNAVVGVTGLFNSSGTLQSMGIQCAFCHSTVDNSHPELCAGQLKPNPGTGCIGHRLDGWPNRDLNVGAIIALAPNLAPIADLLKADQATVRSVLNSWGPGKFDAELLLDGKAFNPEQVSDGTVTGRNISGASLIPPAFGLGGVNLHTWIGWGSVPHWNAFVANLEMHGKGRFFDSRLNNADQLQRRMALRICLTSTPMMISSPQSWHLCSFTSFRFLHRSQPSHLTKTPPSAVTSCLAARPVATTVTSNRCGRNRDGICIPPVKSA